MRFRGRHEQVHAQVHDPALGHHVAKMVSTTRKLFFRFLEYEEEEGK